MESNQIIKAAFSACMLLIFCFCSVRRSEPISGPLALENESVRNGQIHYMHHCQKCHPMGEGGLGPALNSLHVPKFLKAFQVRHGLGAMPSFKKDEISPDNLEDIVAYLQALKKNR